MRFKTFILALSVGLWAAVMVAEAQPPPNPEKCPNDICDKAEQANPNLCPQDCDGDQPAATPPPTNEAPPSPRNGSVETNPPLSIPSKIEDLGWVPDAGLRVDDATLPNAGIDPATGEVYLYYTDHESGQNLLSISPDGLAFPIGEPYSGGLFDSRVITLPDGTFRRYRPNFETCVVESQFSADALTFEDEAGIRYTLPTADNCWVGVNTGFSNPFGEVVWVYLADREGLNNARLAISQDGGETFMLLTDNIFGDEQLGGGGQSFVDPAHVRLPDGRVRIVTMRMGSVYSFISTDERLTEFAFEGLQLAPDDFTEFNITGLFDPKPILLPDGRIRIYVTAALDGENGPTEAIVSATAAP